MKPSRRLETIASDSRRAIVPPEAHDHRMARAAAVATELGQARIVPLGSHDETAEGIVITSVEATFSASLAAR